ncbi:MAG: hypothetical protein OXI88_17295 [Gammaproteobacteria bacterium]|nr:hypothetical protein [Gammaproteobacteria bacterium]MDE0513526.1 hypothetical protein [Gammaproteobacteria bacterium]
MDKQTIHLITLIVAIIGSNAWSHASLSDRINRVESSLSDRMTSLEARVDGIDKRLVIVETSLKANNQYIASVLAQRLQHPDTPGEQ